MHTFDFYSITLQLLYLLSTRLHFYNKCRYSLHFMNKVSPKCCLHTAEWRVWQQHEWKICLLCICSLNIIGRDPGGGQGQRVPPYHKVVPPNNHWKQKHFFFFNLVIWNKNTTTQAVLIIDVKQCGFLSVEKSCSPYSSKWVGSHAVSNGQGYR